MTSFVQAGLAASCVALAVAACGTSNAAPDAAKAPPPNTQATQPAPFVAGGAASGQAPSGDEPAMRTTAGVTSAAPAARAPAKASSCGLRATLKALGERDGEMTYALTLTNNSKTPVRLVVPGDGSQVGWRTPIITWRATVGDRAVEPLEAGRCGMMNAIQSDEVFALAPGESRTLRDWLGWPRYAPGSYDIAVTYRNDPTLGARKGAVAPEVAALLAASSACEITSNTVPVTVK
jgi:hypothetical protein